MPAGAPKGSRNNPNGRPLAGKAHRVTLTATVDPATMEYLKGYAAENRISLGKAVDWVCAMYIADDKE